ncbi:LacI family DNA-binding transcriptional regulator [Oceanobacillus jeddahense]|uniref:LacI family transcriptional regulator n=1 Tax=Oceanobacillus jeddahense TaxID=1462527 RepID=A0ABY5JUY1_9BACI|nr:LacI family DNA-binding transcriptional regulator [Oceanobacillus jeddahense]UUI02963.1 LacI family transcriptional regulator [Oceanobacillus jeddahense]
MKRVTIKDVAKYANVSIGTVSKVINNKGYVSQGTRQKVEESISVLNYQVNANAQSLKALKTRKVAVIVSDISNMYLMSIAKSVEETIRKINYHMILMSHNDKPEIEAELFQIVVQQQVDAMILIPTGANGEIIKRIMDSGIHVIAVDRRVNDVETDYVADSNYKGSFEAINYLQNYGHKRIGVLYGHTRNTIGLERYQGAVDALKEAGNYQQSLICETNFREEEAYLKTMEILSLPNPPTAIYSCNNTMTLGVLQAIKERSMKMPEDLSVIAFGDPVQWKLLTPQLTLMTQQVRQIGLEASMMLKNRLLIEEDFPYRERIIEPVLTPGETVAYLN